MSEVSEEPTEVDAEFCRWRSYDDDGLILSCACGKHVGQQQPRELVDPPEIDRYWEDPEWRAGPVEYGDFTVRLFRGRVWVGLPHQCDSWDIAGEEDGPTGLVNREDAVAALRAFLADGLHALGSPSPRSTVGDARHLLGWA